MGLDAKQYLTPVEVSERYGGKPTTSTLANWRFKKIGPAYIKPGGRVLYPIADLIKWEESRRMETTAAR